MNKKKFKELMQNGAELLVNRDRCSINNETVKRSYVEEMFDNDELICTGRVNNFTRSYQIREK